MTAAPKTKLKVEPKSDPVAHVNVTIGPQFLQLFSNQMYSSPNKVFEELISNSWDAGAATVYVDVPVDLDAADAAIWILDDGESMDLDGLHQLWAVGDSVKRVAPTNARPQIGKFGIGKLSTYLLSEEVTYICRDKTGTIRSITMNYSRIDAGGPKKLFEPAVKLPVHELSFGDVKEMIGGFKDADRIIALIEAGIPRPVGANEAEKEFGGSDVPLPTRHGTWTLAILSSLRTRAREIQPGMLHWILRTALPLKTSIAIVLNEELVVSSKIDTDVMHAWTLGKNLQIDEIEYPEGVKRKVTEIGGDKAHVTVEGVPGQVSGTVTLYADRISGGKSDIVGASHGFFVNIGGRVINPLDPNFGLSNLSHSAWSKFRATVRSDGLDAFLTSNREALSATEAVLIFRAFLMALFNKARTHHDAKLRTTLLDAGKILTRSWGAVSLDPLRRAISEGVAGSAALPGFVDVSGIEDLPDAVAQWQAKAEADTSNILTGVVLQQRSSGIAAARRASCMSVAPSRLLQGVQIAPGATAVFVIGDCRLKDVFVDNASILHRAAIRHGLRRQSRVDRDLPDAKRYLPPPNGPREGIHKRMRTETVLRFTRE